MGPTTTIFLRTNKDLAELARMPEAPKMDNLKQRLRRMYKPYRNTFLDCPT
jgi:N-formylglutamate amidohydrolase